jgi:hypothetical protein
MCRSRSSGSARPVPDGGLHELAVEDALGPHQRPKLDRYATHLFLPCHAVRVDVDNGRLEETEVDGYFDAVQVSMTTMRRSARCAGLFLLFPRYDWL